MSTSDVSPLKDVKRKVEESIKHHNRVIVTDALLYNGGTVLVLLATTTATLWPLDLEGWGWFPKVLTGIATFLIALERALSFGSRWRFHVEMLNGYRTISDMIDFYEILPDDKKYEQLQNIWKDLIAIRRRESNIPGGAIQGSSPPS